MAIAAQMFSGGNGAPIRTRDSTPWGHVNFNMFFDRAKVKSALDKKEIRVLGRTGAWSRGAMGRSIAKAGKVGGKAHTSKPGQPPRWHIRTKGGSLKGGIFFSANLAAGAVIIGPTKFKGKTVQHGGLASTAQLLEEGGSASTTISRYNKPTKAGKLRPPRITRVNGKWKARPFVAPLQKPTQDKLAELSRD